MIGFLQEQPQGAVDGLIIGVGFPQEAVNGLGQLGIHPLLLGVATAKGE